MHLLANENFPRVAVEALRNAGHDTSWVDIGWPGERDDQVLARAATEGRVLLTFDKDFGELIFKRGAKASPGVILFRVPVSSPDEIAHFVVDVIGSRPDWTGHFSVVEPARIRMRELP